MTMVNCVGLITDATAVAVSRLGNEAAAWSRMP